MRVAKHLQLNVANVETILVDDRPVLVVERYDRIVDADGGSSVFTRDFCQALGLPPSKKYEQDAGPTLARIARVLGDVADTASVETFLCAATLNVALGNCDAHGKNFSLLHTQTGVLRLAPLYDILATRLYPLDETLAMYVDAVQKADRVTAGRLIKEATRWGWRRAVPRRSSPMSLRGSPMPSQRPPTKPMVCRHVSQSSPSNASSCCRLNMPTELHESATVRCGCDAECASGPMFHQCSIDCCTSRSRLQQPALQSQKGD